MTCGPGATLATAAPAPDPAPAKDSAVSKWKTRLRAQTHEAELAKQVAAVTALARKTSIQVSPIVDKPIHVSWQMKRGRLNTKAKKRLFKIWPDRISYHKQDGEDPQGVISLASLLQISFIAHSHDDSDSSHARSEKLAYHMSMQCMDGSCASQLQ
jgi:hypothetical protein